MQVEGPDGGGIVDVPVPHQMRQYVAAAIDKQRVIEAAQRRVDGVVFAGRRVDVVDVLVAAVEQDVFALRSQRDRRHEQQRSQEQRHS